MVKLGQKKTKRTKRNPVFTFIFCNKDAWSNIIWDNCDRKVCSFILELVNYTGGAKIQHNHPNLGLHWGKLGCSIPDLWKNSLFFFYLSKQFVKIWVFVHPNYETMISYFGCFSSIILIEDVVEYIANPAHVGYTKVLLPNVEKYIVIDYKLTWFVLNWKGDSSHLECCFTIS